MTVLLQAISVYPVKSTAPRPLLEVEVEALGLAWDRRWMVVGPDGECVTARRDRSLLLLRAVPTPTGLRLASVREDRPSLEVPEPTGPSVQVTVHGRPLRGIPAAAEARDWVGALLGRDDVRLIHLSEPRALNPAHSRTQDRTAFADGYPVTLASTASLRRVQDWVADSALERGEEPTRITMERFRPNLVVDGDLDAFVEDGWQQVRIGSLAFDVAKCIDRCVLTTVDPGTLQSGLEPIRSLARHHAWDGVTWFGIQLIPRGAGTLHLGDPVIARSRGC